MLLSMVVFYRECHTPVTVIELNFNEDVFFYSDLLRQLVFIGANEDVREGKQVVSLSVDL